MSSFKQKPAKWMWALAAGVIAAGLLLALPFAPALLRERLSGGLVGGGIFVLALLFFQRERYQELPPEERRELDYLKRVKRRSRFRILAAVVCTVLVIAGGFAAKIFLIGTPIQSQTYALRHYVDEENVLHLIIDCVNSAWAYHGWKTEETDGVVEISGRSVTVSPVHKEGWGRLKVPLEGVREVRLCGDVVYQDGVVIGSAAMQRCKARTPYVGDAPALGRVAEAVGLDGQNWNYITELQTGERPYRWTIKFQNHWGDTSAGKWMRYYYGPQMLALVDNLDEVGWTYTTATSSGKTFCEGVLTLEEADAHLAELLEELCKLDFHWIRLHYLYPDQMDDRLIDVIAREEKILKYLDIPLQHCNDGILRKMNRRGDKAYIENLLDTLREKIPGVVLRTSLITGLPGEGEAEFEELCQFLWDQRMLRAGVFPYSPEEGTPAAKMDRVDTSEAERRAELVVDIQSRIMDQWNEDMQGEVVEVLCEGFDGQSMSYVGRSWAESPDIDGRIYFTADGEVEAGTFVRVRITGAMDGELTGELADE